MQRGGEGDVLGIAGVAAVLLQVAVAEILLVHRGYPAGCQGECLDAGGGTFRAFVEMDADKDRVGELVGKRGSVVQGNEDIARAGEVDGVSALLKEALGAEDDIKGGVLFEASAAFGSAVVTAVAGIKDNGAEGGGVFDEAGAHDRLDDFCHIHCRNQNFPILLPDRKAQDILDIVDENLALARLAADFAAFGGHFKEAAVFCGRLELVKSRNILDRHMTAPLDHDEIPGGRGVGDSEEKNEDQEGRTKLVPPSAAET